MKNRIHYLVTRKNWRPSAYGIERDGNHFLPVVVLKTESGKEQRIVGGSSYDDENRAAEVAQDLLAYARRI